MGRRNRDRSPIARRSSMGARRSRSPRDKRRSTGGPNRGRDRSREKRAEHEIYIGNYPVRFRESDVRKLFEENGITVSTIRLKHDGLKVFAFAETDSLEMIEKAKNAMEGKEINGRNLRVRSSKDKSEREAEQRAKNSKKETEENNKKRSRGTEREVGRDDIKKYLVAAFIDFMDREVEAAGEEAPGEYKGLMDAAKKALAAAYSLPEDESFKVNKELEDIFLGSVRREIKLPELPKAEKTEETETSSNSDGKVDKDADDDGNWKRRKVAKDDEDEDDAMRKEDESEEISLNEQDNEENDEEMEDLDEGDADADTTSPPEAEEENEEAGEKIVEEVEDKQEVNEGESEGEDEEVQGDDNEENLVSEPKIEAPKSGRGRGRGRGSRSSRK